jgi:Fe-S-cluster-containing dehydrogenase component
MKGIVPTDDLPHAKLASNQRVVIKSQKRVDMGPFVRFSCWHCENPPCAGRCPFNAITKLASGAVAIDPSKCRPGEFMPGDPSVQCVQQCKIDCQRGGVPMIGAGSDLFKDWEPRAWKCTLCTGGYPGAPYVGAGAGGDLPTKASAAEQAQGDGDRAHQPSCVFTCPAKAMRYDTRARILSYLNTGVDPDDADAPVVTWMSRFGDGSMFWASQKFLVAPPKADPFIEDHASPMIGSLLSSPFAKAALAPTLVVGGLLALAARRAKLEEEASMTGEER